MLKRMELMWTASLKLSQQSLQVGGNYRPPTHQLAHLMRPGTERETLRCEREPAAAERR